MITLLIVDDHRPVRRALRAWLAAQPDITVVGEARDGTMAVALASQLQPDIVLMDIAMPGMDGIAAMALLQAGGTSAAVIAYSIYDDPVSRARAAAAGAVAFVAKHRTHELLLPTIRAVVGRSAVP